MEIRVPVSIVDLFNWHTTQRIDGKMIFLSDEPTKGEHYAQMHLELGGGCEVLSFDPRFSERIDFEISQGGISRFSIMEIVESAIRRKANIVFSIKIGKFDSEDAFILYSIVSIKVATEALTNNYGSALLEFDFEVCDSI